MKFIIEYGNTAEQRLLTYIPQEHSFDMEPIENKIDFELALNKLTLSVVDNKIVQLWGFCGFNKSMKSDYKVPAYERGDLTVQHNLNFGFVYGINDKDLPVYVNTETGWVCIGNPEINHNAVEFITNCVAVIDDENNFRSLWLNPQQLPDI